MRAILNRNNQVLKRGDNVRIYKFDDRSQSWIDTMENGSFEEVVGQWVNFNAAGKPRQCMPEGIGARVE